MTRTLRTLICFPFSKMPADSTHEDALAMHEVVIEKWLTKEEYDAALKVRKLAWQLPEVEATILEAEIPMETEAVIVRLPHTLVEMRNPS